VSSYEENASKTTNMDDDYITWVGDQEHFTFFNTLELGEGKSISQCDNLLIQGKHHPLSHRMESRTPAAGQRVQLHPKGHPLLTTSVTHVRSQNNTIKYENINTL
jgi:hypothetical protein